MSLPPSDKLQEEHTLNGASNWKVTFEQKTGILLKSYFLFFRILYVVLKYWKTSA